MKHRVVVNFNWPKHSPFGMTLEKIVKNKDLLDLIDHTFEVRTREINFIIKGRAKDVVEWVELLQETHGICQETQAVRKALYTNKRVINLRLLMKTVGEKSG